MCWVRFHKQQPYDKSLSRMTRVQNFAYVSTNVYIKNVFYIIWTIMPRKLLIERCTEDNFYLVSKRLHLF